MRMQIFFSVGEPSGDQHGAHLIRELRRRVPAAEFVGYGGPLMEQAGLRKHFQLTDLAVMGIWAVIPLLWTFFRLVRDARRYFAEQKPDAVVLIDFPGFNWWVARQAKRAGIKVFYYMPPQLWAWAPWRIRKVRKFVDHVLAALPFEAEWYAQRDVDVEYVGQPFFDEVAEHPLDNAFCRELRGLPVAGEDRRSRMEDGEKPADQIHPPSSILHPPAPQAQNGHSSRARLLALLPGSRNMEVRRNFPVMLQVARLIHARHPDVRFPVACYKTSQRDYCRSLLAGEFADLPINLYVGRTPEIIATADCCLMVSGSVSLELLARGTPAVVLYRGSWLFRVLVHLLVTCRYMSLPNLIAGRMLMPEFPFVGRVAWHARRMADVLDGWLTDERALAAVRGEMEQLRTEVARTGGVGRAADAIVARLGTNERLRRTA
jgi:lipid-A-disaccharide synthase